jgi:titin
VRFPQFGVVSGMLQVGVNHYQGQRFGIGIAIRGQSEDTLVIGNLVGTDALGTNPIPNVAGVGAFDASRRSTIGGTAAGEANTIAFSERIGMTVDSLATSVAIRGNRIFANGALGIDLFTFSGGGVTPNDPGDTDTDGGNHLQNFPVIAHAVALGPALLLVGSLDSTPSQRFAIDFYASPTSDPSGFGEGMFFLGSTTVITSADGDATFEKFFALPVPSGWVVTATATNAVLGETSEFSAAARVSTRMLELPLMRPERQ